jgi:hypothetical protein
MNQSGRCLLAPAKNPMSFPVRRLSIEIPHAKWTGMTLVDILGFTSPLTAATQTLSAEIVAQEGTDTPGEAASNLPTVASLAEAPRIDLKQS